MKNKYLIGVDVGTQSAKVTVFDLGGRIVCQGKQALRRLDIPTPQRAEHPDDDLWVALQAASKQAMSEFRDDFGGRDKDILAIGICIIRCCRVLMAPDGNLAYPVINWMDERINDPYRHEEAYGEVRYVTTTSGYITHRLTGEPKDTCANYIGWWPMDDDTLDWTIDREFFESCRVPREMLFDVVRPGHVLGRVTRRAAELTGLPADAPVVATAHDKAVEALGCGSLGEGTALISLGTYIGAMVHGREHKKDAKSFWSFQASIPGKYLYECPGVRRGMWTVSWFCDQFGGAVAREAAEKGLSIEDMFNREAAGVPAGCDGLITVHDWTPPVDAMYRKGVMFGFDGRHTRAHIYRSILEGIAFRVKSHMDRMLAELNMPLERLIISGGGANSDLFVRIFADVFGLPARRNEMNGAAALGAAINAALAVGAFESYDRAIEAMVRPGKRFEPDEANNRTYTLLLERVYSRIHQHFDPLLQELSPLVG